MKSITRLTVAIPTELVEAMDQKLVRGSESRSAVIRRLIENALSLVEEPEATERWKQSYREAPQSEDYAPWSDDTAPERLLELPRK
jgi:metal-responsive CopG/Arc/MetJ family transcriptional regulator